MASVAVGSLVASSGRAYVIELTLSPGVIAVCTPEEGSPIVLDVLESTPGPLIFRRDSSEDGRELAAYLARWFATRTRARRKSSLTKS